MSVTITFEYLGALRCRATHEPSGSHIETDAPKDNRGKGEAFSPTDLVGLALVSCAVTTMAIRADEEGLAFGRATGRVVKEMTSSPPRRIARLRVDIVMPQGIEPARRAWFELIGRRCPVALSLSDDLEAELHFTYPD
ncbi:MAG: OsmC family protein [Deltaproteobacteria bacterium]|nr:OsmC family protein [Deltaproteobacteria bacterium]